MIVETFAKETRK